MFLRVNSQLRAHHFISEVGNGFSHVRHYLSALHFSCHFLGQSLTSRSFCNSSRSLLLLNILNNLEALTKSSHFTLHSLPLPGTLHIGSRGNFGATRGPTEELCPMERDGREEPLWLPMVLMGINIWEQWGQAPGNPSNRYLQRRVVLIHYPQDSSVNGIEEPLMTIKSKKIQ